MRTFRNSRNSRGGTSTVELGPALFILIICVLIPAMDLLYLAMTYAAGWYLNHVEVREVACHDPTSAANVSSALSIAYTAWQKSILCGFCNAQSTPHTEKVTFYVGNPPGGTAYPGVAPATPPVDFCNVVTTLQIKPLFVVPFIGGVPGLSAPVTFVYADTRPQEERGIK
jgi:hypothetical protein